MTERRFVRLSFDKTSDDVDVTALRPRINDHYNTTSARHGRFRSSLTWDHWVSYMELNDTNYEHRVRWAQTMDATF